MGYCANCGAQIPENATFCFACNTRLDTGGEPPESPPTQVANQEKEPKPNKAETAHAMHCTSCGAQLPENAKFCFACGTKCVSNAKTGDQTPSRRKPIARWLLVAIGVCAIAAIGVLVWRTTQPEPVTSFPSSATGQSATPTTAAPTVTASPPSILLTGTVGQQCPSQRITIQCSDVDADFTWRAARDAAWLDVVPSTDSFDLGFSDFSVRVSPDGLGEGTHTATVSLSIDGFEGDAATIQVTLEMQAPEDPEVVAIRAFWESSVYQRYWGSGAQTDARAAVRAYSFPEYDDHGTVDAVDIESVEFEFLPDVYPRPIALVHCSAKFVVMEDLEKTVRTRVTYYTDTMVILEVAPGPFSATHNEWNVIAVFGYADWVQQ